MSLVRSVRIEPGYRPGFLARTLEMHVDHYSQAASWGQAFEADLAKSFGDLVSRMPTNPDCQVWCAVQQPPKRTGPPEQSGEGTGDERERIVGTIMLDAGDGDAGVPPATARMRGFIVDEAARGAGAGRALLAAAMAFVNERGFGKVVLHTLWKLDIAVGMYRRAGFELESDEVTEVWGQDLRVLQFAWTRDGTRDEDLDTRADST